MRPIKQFKAIFAQIELLYEFKDDLQSVLDYTNKAIEKGNSWLDETSDESFQTVNSYLAIKSSMCRKRLQNIVDRSELCQQPLELSVGLQDSIDRRKKPYTLPKYHDEDVNENMQSQERDRPTSLPSKKCRVLEKQFQDHTMEMKVMISRAITESENKYKVRFDRFNKELNKTREYMCLVHDLVDDVTNLVKENEKQMSSFEERVESVCELAKQNGQKIEIVMEKQNRRENRFRLRGNEDMKGQRSPDESYRLSWNEAMAELRSKERFRLRGNEAIAGQRSPNERYRLRGKEAMAGQRSPNDTYCLEWNEAMAELRSKEWFRFIGNQATDEPKSP